jgi:acetyltransferase-like isoleucine patch superfamily enzyme
MQRILGINGDVPWMVHFTSTVVMPSKSHLQIGDRVWVSFAVSGGCYVQAANGIRIGARTIFAPGVKIISANHSVGNLDSWEPAPPLIIGEDCWIGANAVILPGVQLGDRVVVGAGAVVTKSVSSDCVVAGVPATRLHQKAAYA